MPGDTVTVEMHQQVSNTISFPIYFRKPKLHLSREIARVRTKPLVVLITDPLS